MPKPRLTARYCHVERSSLGHRLRKLETKTQHVTLVSSVRIVAWNEADKERQIAELLAAGVITPQMIVVCRMVVPAGAVRQC